MGDVNKFLLNKLIDEYIEYFESFTEKTMTKKEYIILFINFMLGSELNLNHTEDQNYFQELCEYYIENNNLTEKEKEYMWYLIKEERIDVTKYGLDDVVDSEFLKVFIKLLEWMNKNIIISE